ncbi:MAG: NMCC_0638 family (lipo)protein [Paraglaciecola chathamensis]
MQKIIILVIFTFTLMSCGSNQSKPDDSGLSLRKSEAIQTYMGACVASRANPVSVKSQAQDMGFTSLSGNAAQKYLSGKPGMAWSKTTSTSSYGLTLLENSLCSIFIHKGNPTTLQASMEAWLPPANSGFTYQKNFISQRGTLTTTQYQIFRSGVLMEQWVITTNTQANAELVAIMTYDGP